MTDAAGGMSRYPTIFAPASESAADATGDELERVLQAFAEQCGADFGLLLHFMDGEARGHLLASWQALPDGVAASRELVAATIAEHCALRHGRAPALQLLVANGITLELSTLHFSMGPGVEIVAVFGRAQAPTARQDLLLARLRALLECYLRLWLSSGKQRRQVGAMRQALEVNDLGIVLLDRRCSVLFANRYAETLLAEGDGLQRRGSCLGSCLPEDLLRLQSAMQYAVLYNRLAPGSDRIRWPARMVAVRRRSRRSLILTLLSIERLAVDADDPAVIVYVLDPEHDVRKLLAPAYRIYQLTAVESRLATELVGGASLSEAAAAISVRPHTARGYLKQIFAKTQTNRQADLIILMLASAARSSPGADLSLL